jgi:hypothetical protein
MNLNFTKGAFLIALISMNLFNFGNCGETSSNGLISSSNHRYNGVFKLIESNKHNKVRPRTWFEKYFGDIESLKRIRQEAYFSSLQNYI